MQGGLRSGRGSRCRSWNNFTDCELRQTWRCGRWIHIWIRAENYRRSAFAGLSSKTSCLIILSSLTYTKSYPVAWEPSCCYGQRQIGCYECQKAVHHERKRFDYRRRWHFQWVVFPNHHQFDCHPPKTSYLYSHLDSSQIPLGCISRRQLCLAHRGE